MPNHADPPQIMFVDVLLNNRTGQPVVLEAKIGANDDCVVTKIAPRALGKFLKIHSTAKIIVVLDTHSLTNGFFVWKGNSEKRDYEACGMLEVSAMCRYLPLLTLPQILRDCIPEEVFEFISNEDGTPTHQHKSLILNLACGYSVSEDPARFSMMEGWVSGLMTSSLISSPVLQPLCGCRPFTGKQDDTRW